MWNGSLNYKRPKKKNIKSFIFILLGLGNKTWERKLARNSPRSHKEQHTIILLNSQDRILLALIKLIEEVPTYLGNQNKIALAHLKVWLSLTTRIKELTFD